ncbi:MAG TPA: TetR/AcrR family transcriptional regulator [Myxococcota bacterium]|nr:TetR/AcrR family transcriptional regulator [Myxococcota bacterium]
MKRSASKVPRRPAVRRAAPLRRASLCQAGWALLREAGPAAVTIEAVVARAGVSRPIFYRHFRDRAHFLAELYEDYTLDLARRTEAALARGGDPEAQMAGALSSYLDCVGERGAYIRTLAEYAADLPDLQRARERTRKRQLDLLAGALQAAGIAAPPATLRLYVRLLHGLAMDAATLWLRGEASRAAVEEAVRLIERGTFRLAREELAHE